jgi:hypothetical protein
LTQGGRLFLFRFPFHLILPKGRLGSGSISWPVPKILGWFVVHCVVQDPLLLNMSQGILEFQHQARLGLKVAFGHLASQF